MSDLNDFFAKKDKKKKKGAKGKAPGIDSPGGLSSNSATRPASAASASVGDASSSGIVKTSGATRASKGDDGWIDIDEEKAQVNTGGRTVADFKRDNDDKIANGEHNAPTEKFSGWSIKDGEEDTDAQGEAAAAPVTSYPSLAESADAPEVPKTSGVSGGGGGGNPARPRYGQSGFAAGLRKMLEERKAAEAAGKPAN